MKELIRNIERRKRVLERAIELAERDAKGLPEGKLRISSTRKQKRYFRIIECPVEGRVAGSNENGEIVSGAVGCEYEYIPVNNKQLPRQLAQKEYNVRFLEEARFELDGLERERRRLLRRNANGTFERLPDCRKELVRPYILSDEEYAKAWQKQDIAWLEYRQEEKKYDTNRGDRVRSKSEALIANLIFDLGIPYHYEKGVRLRDGRIKYPDFTLLDVRHRKEIYWEHLGLIDDDMYRWDNLGKLNEYRRNGIYSLKNLIVTYESEQNPLDIAGIRGMLKEVFCNDD